MRGATADPSALSQQIQETTVAPGPSESLFELKHNFGDYIMQEVDDYIETGMAMINVRP